MLILMKNDHTKEQLGRVVEHIKGMGFTPTVIPGDHSVAVAITGNQTSPDREEFMALAGVEKAIPVSKPYKLASRECKSSDTIINVGGVAFGGKNFAVIGGPCAVESLEQMRRIATIVKEAGGSVLRGGAYKPRVSPYSFQGLGKKGLEILKEVKEEMALPVITEALDMESLEYVNDFADIIQIGARNMQNFSLLKAVGHCDKPVMLKRGMSATLDELLMAAEYILDSGNKRVILCERGIRSFDNHTRNLLDLAAVAVLKTLTHLPIVVDPSHGTGRRDLIIPTSRAALAIGANSVIVEVHDNPEAALCDGPQALDPVMFKFLVQSLRDLSAPLGIKFIENGGSYVPS